MTLSRNAAWNIAEVLGSTAVLFLIYKLVLGQLGVGALGVWSLVLAITSVARLADLGATGGVTRYVALTHARETSSTKAMSYVHTAMAINAALYAILALAVYWPVWRGLAFVLRGDDLVQARELLPFALAALALFNVSNVLSAALVGLHKSFRKSQIVLAAQAIQGSLAFTLIGSAGLTGIAIAQIAQYGLLIIVGWLLATRSLTGSWRVFTPVTRSAARDLIGLGLRLQVLNIVSFPLEPITKVIYSSFGGVEALGLYELASRAVLQVRQVVVAPTQNLTPLYASKEGLGGAEVGDVYQSATAKIITASALAMIALLAGSPAISWMWLGRVNGEFVMLSAILCLGWFANMVCTPAYLLGIGVGLLRWNIVGASLSTIGCVGLGTVLGERWAGLGVASGAMTAVGIGSIVTCVMNCRAIGIAPLPSSDHWRTLARQLKSLSLRRIIRARFR